MCVQFFLFCVRLCKRACVCFSPASPTPLAGWMVTYFFFWPVSARAFDCSIADTACRAPLSTRTHTHTHTRRYRRAQSTFSSSSHMQMGVLSFVTYSQHRGVFRTCLLAKNICNRCTCAFRVCLCVNRLLSCACALYLSPFLLRFSDCLF